MKLIAKYEAEQKELSVEVAELEETLSIIRQDKEYVEPFIERMKKYTDVQEITCEMCLELVIYLPSKSVLLFVKGTTANIYAHLDYSSKLSSAQAMADGIHLPNARNFTIKWDSVGTETAKKRSIF